MGEQSSLSPFYKTVERRTYSEQILLVLVQRSGKVHGMSHLTFHKRTRARTHTCTHTHMHARTHAHTHSRGRTQTHVLWMCIMLWFFILSRFFAEGLQSMENLLPVLKYIKTKRNCNMADQQSCSIMSSHRTSSQTKFTQQNTSTDASYSTAP